MNQYSLYSVLTLLFIGGNKKLPDFLLVWLLLWLLICKWFGDNYGNLQLLADFVGSLGVLIY